MRDEFNRLADAVCGHVPGVDRITFHFSAESSDFVRFNRGAVRQATHVSQRYGSVSVSRGLQHAASRISLSGNPVADTQALLDERQWLIENLPRVPEDRHLRIPESVVSTERDVPGHLPQAIQVIDAVVRHGAGTDLVGFYAGGPVIRAFADSRGQRNWHRVESFHFEWCIYREADQAVKSTYAGSQWDEAAFAERLRAAREQVTLLSRPLRTLAPGAYRAWFSPVAVADLLGTLSWGGFGLKEVRTGVSSLIRAHRGEASFHPSVSMSEATHRGIAPDFQPDGFVKPAAIALIDGGRATGTLISPRSAGEYDISPNGANEGEAPESLSMAGGTLAANDMLATLGTGVYVSDLHYLNYSDRQACRMTGMTRFACFWVEAGELVAPISVMRFDDSLLRMFGSGLVGLSSESQLTPDSATYRERQLRSVTAPAAIVDGFRLTL
jgi:predicted Zn-dependent protease